MFDGIIFDVDGTLWDSTPVVEKAWNQALEEAGYEARVTAEQLKGLFGLPMNEIINAILPDVTQEEQDDFAPLCYKHEHEYLDRESGRLYPEILETIREIAKSHKVFIVSNCQAGYIELFIEKTGIGDVVTDHVCLGDNNLLKADNIKLIVEKYGLKRAVYIGDIQGDADSSKKAGVEFIHAAYGFGTVDACFAAVNRPCELIEAISGRRS